MYEWVRAFFSRKQARRVRRPLVRRIATRWRERRCKSRKLYVNAAYSASGALPFLKPWQYVSLKGRYHQQYLQSHAATENLKRTVHWNCRVHNTPCSAVVSCKDTSPLLLNYVIFKLGRSVYIKHSWKKYVQMSWHLLERSGRPRSKRM
jgi:hypothetical protein